MLPPSLGQVAPVSLSRPRRGSDDPTLTIEVLKPAQGSPASLARYLCQSSDADTGALGYDLQGPVLGVGRSGFSDPREAVVPRSERLQVASSNQPALSDPSGG